MPLLVAPHGTADEGARGEGPTEQNTRAQFALKAHQSIQRFRPSVAHPLSHAGRVVPQRDAGLRAESTTASAAMAIHASCACLLPPPHPPTTHIPDVPCPNPPCRINDVPLPPPDEVVYAM